MVTVPDMVAAKHLLKALRAEQLQDIGTAMYPSIHPSLEINPRYEHRPLLEYN